MIPSRAAGSRDYVPLSERLVALQAVRVLLVLVVVGHAATTGGSYAGAILGASATYSLVSVVLELVRRLVNRSALPVVGLMLTFDVLFLGAVMVATGGPQSRLMFAIYIHLISVTLLLSFRSGLKVAVGHSTAIFVSYYARAAGLTGALWTAPSGRPGELQRAAVEGAIGFWLVAMITAALSSLTERELRRGKVQLRALADMGVEMEAGAGTGPLLERLCLAVVAGFGERRVAATASSDGQGWLAVRDSSGCVVTSANGEPGEAVERAWAARRTELVRELSPGEGDGVIDRALPGATNVAIIPLVAESQMIGALAVEFGGGKRTRVRSRQIEMLEQFAAHAALEIRSAWLLAEVRRLATTDALTGLANRRSLQTTMTREVARAGRGNHPLGIVLLDLDHFKSINDTHGHQIGDEVLRGAAQAISTVMRAGDMAARYGGEEFCVVLPDTDGAGALVAAERIRAAIAGSDCAVKVTASAGAACMPVNAATVDGLLAAADEALYEAKDTGRNRAVSSRRTRRRPVVPASL